MKGFSLSTETDDDTRTRGNDMIEPVLLYKKHLHRSDVLSGHDGDPTIGRRR